MCDWHFLRARVKFGSTFSGLIWRVYTGGVRTLTVLLWAYLEREKIRKSGGGNGERVYLYRSKIVCGLCVNTSQDGPRKHGETFCFCHLPIKEG